MDQLAGVTWEFDLEVWILRIVLTCVQGVSMCAFEVSERHWMLTRGSGWTEVQTLNLPFF